MNAVTTHQAALTVDTRGKGTTEITRAVAGVVDASGVDAGLAHVFLRHTSCSLVIMENADPSARRDLEAFMERLVPEDEPYYVHTAEGPDDSPSHIRMALTRTSETVPVVSGRLGLGTWQGVYLWEHRAAPHRRELVVTVQGTAAKSKSKNEIRVRSDDPSCAPDS